MGLAGCGHNSRSGVSCGVEVQWKSHCGQHPHHAVAHVIGHDRLDAVVAQESSHPGMVSGPSALIMQSTPRDLELLPILDLATSHVSHCDPIGPTPAGVDRSIAIYGHAYDHASRILHRKGPTWFVDWPDRGS